MEITIVECRFGECEVYDSVHGQIADFDSVSEAKKHYPNAKIIEDDSRRAFRNRI